MRTMCEDIFQLIRDILQVQSRLPQWQRVSTTSLLSFSLLVPLLASCNSGTETGSTPESSVSPTPVSGA
ncbi:MAG: hypothetical protein PUP92_14545, partial [Rhizonema sp. PD38]|nr:hypothetical protein [Rhizonema sp. PD38]